MKNKVSKKSISDSSAFIESMMVVPTLAHERSHINSFKDMSPIAREFRAIFASDEGDSAGGILLESLADFGGFFNYIVDTAVNNKPLALAIVYGFCSDSWYVSPENPSFKKLLSFVQVSLALHFLNSSGDDFRFLNDDGKINLPKMIKERERIYRALLGAYEDHVQELIDIIKESNYSICCSDNNIIEMEFKELKNEVACHLYDLKEDPNQDLFEDSSFWINMQGYLKQWSEEGWNNYQAALCNAEIRLEKLVLMLINEGEGNEQIL